MLGDSPLELRVYRAEVEPSGTGPDEVSRPTDRACRLTAVAEHAPLQRLLDRAADRPTGEWVTAGISREVGDDVVLGLEAHCEDTGGLNLYQGEPYWTSVQFTDAEGAAGHHSGDGHEHTHTSG